MQYCRFGKINHFFTLRGHLKIYTVLSIQVKNPARCHTRVDEANVFTCLHPGYGNSYTRLYTPLVLLCGDTVCVYMYMECIKSPRKPHDQTCSALSGLPQRALVYTTCTYMRHVYVHGTNTAQTVQKVRLLHCTMFHSIKTSGHISQRKLHKMARGKLQGKHV